MLDEMETMMGGRRIVDVKFLDRFPSSEGWADIN